MVNAILAGTRPRPDVSERPTSSSRSDNGHLMGQHRAVGLQGRPPTRSRIGVPLVVRGPGVRVGSVDEPVLNVDLPATLLELAGVDIPDSVEGRSLAPFLRGAPPSSWRTEVLIENYGLALSYGLRTRGLAVQPHGHAGAGAVRHARRSRTSSQSLHRKADPALLDSLEQRIEGTARLPRRQLSLARPSATGRSNVLSCLAVVRGATCERSDSRDQRFRLQRNPAGSSARERAGEGLRARLPRAGRAEVAPERDVRRAHRDPARDRRARGAERRAGQGRDAARPRPRARGLAQGLARARLPGDRGGGRGAARVGELALGGPPGRLPEGGRAARDHLARAAQRRDHARPVEDGLPGGDRLGGGARRLLALQPALRAGALPGAAALERGDLEPARLPAARGLRLRGDALQLHVDRGQPADRPGPDGQHRRLEAGLRRRSRAPTSS